MTESYPCCPHCDHGPDFVHEQPCQALIIEGEECRPPLSWWILYARKIDQRDWIERLAFDWGLIRIPESLSPNQLKAQIDMHLRRLGHKFHTTTPGTPFVIDIPEPQAFACPRCGATRWHAEMYTPGMAVTCMECGWSEWVTEIDRRIQDGEL